jgi:hypothetical protein
VPDDPIDRFRLLPSLTIEPLTPAPGRPAGEAAARAES